MHVFFDRASNTYGTGRPIDGMIKYLSTALCLATAYVDGTYVNALLRTSDVH